MKKKYVLKNKTRFSSFIIVLMVVLITAFFANTVYGYKEITYKTISVKQGDTLWDIAKKSCTRSDIRKFIYEIKKINHLDNSVIKVGDELQIPIEH